MTLTGNGGNIKMEKVSLCFCVIYTNIVECFGILHSFKDANLLSNFILSSLASPTNYFVENYPISTCVKMHSRNADFPLIMLKVIVSTVV